MRGIGGSTLRGGQTVFHGLRMWGQLFRAAMFLAALTTVAVPAWTLWHRTTGAEWYAAGMVTLAEIKLVLGYDVESGQEIRFADGTRRVMSIRDIAAAVPAREAREHIRDEIFASAWLGGDGRRRIDRAVPRRVLGPRRAARPAEAHQGRRNGDGRRVAPAGAGAASPRARAAAGREAAAALLDRGHPLAGAHRDPAHHRLGDHGLGQDGADLGPGGADPRPRRALRDLRQDGLLHGGLLRPRPRRADETRWTPARRAGRPSWRRATPATST